MGKKKTLRQYEWEREWTADKRAWSLNYKKEKLAQTTLEQRKTFIEEMRKRGGFDIHAAMSASGITDISAAVEVYMKNSRPSKTRHLVDPEKVR